MKNLLSVLILIPLGIFAQDVSIPDGDRNHYHSTIAKDTSNLKKIHYGIAVHQFIELYGLPTSFLFTFHYRKHQFDLGPTFQLGRTINKFNKDIGAEFNYRFYPNGDETKFSSFIFFNSNYFHDHLHSSRTIYNPGSLEFHNQKVEEKDIDHTLAFNWGYGIKFKFVKGFYISSNVGLGFVNEVSIIERTLVNTGKIYDSRKRSDREFGIIFGISLGYKF